MNFVVVGATKGLGLCLTKLLLENGHQVAAGAIEITEELNALNNQYPQQLYLFHADVTDEQEMTSCATACKEKLGSIDAVCNVAGVLLPNDREKLLYECDIEELKTTFLVNVIGAVIAVKSFYPHLDNHAKFFTVTSEGSGIQNCGTWVPCYGLSKTAETKMSGILNQSTSNVDFYSVHPGRMNTDMGRTTAQIEPETSALGFYSLMTGETKLSRDKWYIDYLGNDMPC